MTLTQAAIFTKRGMLIFVGLIILGVLAKVGYSIWYQHYLSTLPPVVEKPESKFGSLPAIVFPPSTVTSSNFTYSIDTTSGNLPDLPNLLKVYYIPQAAVTLLAPQKAQELARKLNFSDTPQASSSTTYNFSDTQGSSLVVDLPTGNFQLRFVASSSGNLQGLGDETTLLSQFKDYLNNKNLLTPELLGGRGKVSYDSSTPQTSQTALVSIWPSDFDKLPIMTASPTKSLVWALVRSSSDPDKKYLQLNYTFWPIDQTTSSTYQLKPILEGYKQLQSGKGYITQAPLKTAQVSITKVYLAYYQQEKYTPYLQPIFVFEGPNFQALVPAIAQ